MQTVQQVARQGWVAEPPLVGAVAVTIAYFYDSDLLDVDNIPKPVLDTPRRPCWTPSATASRFSTSVWPKRRTGDRIVMEEASNAEYLLARKTAEDYRRKGDAVAFDAPLDFLPGFRADLVASKVAASQADQASTRAASDMPDVSAFSASCTL